MFGAEFSLSLLISSLPTLSWGWMHSAPTLQLEFLLEKWDLGIGTDGNIERKKGFSCGANTRNGSTGSAMGALGMMWESLECCGSIGKSVGTLGMP